MIAQLFHEKLSSLFDVVTKLNDKWQGHTAYNSQSPMEAPANCKPTDARLSAHSQEIKNTHKVKNWQLAASGEDG